MIDFFVTFDYLCSFKNSYEYLVLPQKMPHRIINVASVWQKVIKCCKLTTFYIMIIEEMN